MEVNSISSVLDKTRRCEETSEDELKGAASILKEIDHKIMSDIYDHMIKSSDVDHGLIVWIKPDATRTSWNPEPLHLREMVEYFENIKLISPQIIMYLTY